MINYVMSFFVGIVFTTSVVNLFEEQTTFYADGKRAGYKQGQIDCANGDVKFELKKMPDGSTSWQPKVYQQETKTVIIGNNNTVVK